MDRTQEQPDGRDAEGNVCGKGHGASTLPNPHGSPTWKLSELHPLGVLRRLHYKGMID